MEYIKEIRHGVDAGYGVQFHPANGEGRKGKHGINQNLTLEEVIRLARSMEEKPNIIIKSGEKAKWYLKRYTMEELPGETLASAPCTLLRTHRNPPYPPFPKVEPKII